jgi:hypothetical protein
MMCTRHDDFFIGSMLIYFSYCRKRTAEEAQVTTRKNKRAKLVSALSCLM